LSSVERQAAQAVDRFFAPCPRGLEQQLAAELRLLGAKVDQTAAGGVAFSGERSIGWLANLHSRIASRVLLQVAQGRYRDDDDLYRLANRTEWERWFSSAQTLRVDVNAIRSPMRSLNFATLRIKDGVVDRFRTRTGARPSIDTERPDARIFGFLQERVAALYLDLSGEPLFKRGWRSERDDKGEAPLKENLAAGLLALAGWTPEQPLYDPFCGSGTIVIEAAQQALGIAPGLSRGFAFERLLDFDAPRWAALRADAVQRVQTAGDDRLGSLRIAASDADPKAVEQTLRNAERAGLPAQALLVRVCDAGKASPPFDTPGVIVTNPPYGERIELDVEDGERGSAERPSGWFREARPDDSRPGRLVPAARAGAAAPAPQEDVDAAWTEIGAAFKERFGGWSVWMLSSDSQLPRKLGIKERRRTPLYNGAIECRLFGFEIFEAGAVRPRRGARSPD
jgi:putative N6-adenine-specific DNA methylase